MFAYFLVGLLLRLYTSVNILPPCLWTAIFHVHCPGCGMTRACLRLMQFDFAGAWHANPLTIPVIVGILAAIVVDFRKFTLHLQHPTEKKG
ncbi:MAG: DUF2752 domain-containing protein [Bacteroidaceae bacterium]|nr:DUF2752 domain-containing protein [Bacteroidaceae bacterium]